MKRYTKPNDDRYQFLVIHTLNGYSIEVLVVPTEDLAAITPTVAAQLHTNCPTATNCKAAPKWMQKSSWMNWPCSMDGWPWNNALFS